MSCNCTGNCDLISVNSLVLSDTFHTWYDRTNEIIDAINPIQVYDVNVGMTDGGLTAQTTCIGGNSNGVITLKVWPGPGIGVGTTVTPNYYLNHTMIDVSNMTIKGVTGYDDAIIPNRLATSFPNGNDWFIVSDTLDSSLGSGAGTPKRIQANHMLPQTVYLPSGFQFNGNVSINGNLSIQGTASNVDSNDLRIEDKIIELAFHRLVSIDVTGPTYGNSFAAPGVTFYYYDPGVGNTGAYTTVGQISSVTSLGGGVTNLKLHAFNEGGAEDIVSGGRLSITGQFFDFTIAAGPTTTEAYYDDDTLNEAGIQIHGVTADKNFLWVYKRGVDTYNAFLTTTNLGVSGPSNAIISSKFLSYGYGATNGANINNTFHFQGYNGASPTIRLGGLGTGSDQYGYWSVQQQNYGGTGTQQPLVFGFKQYSVTGENTSFTIWSGASGQTYGGVTSAAGFVNVAGQGSNRVSNFAQGLNVDFLDGAHGTTLSTAWSIPIALSTGKIHPDWVDTSSIGKCYSFTGHSFRVGDAVRLNPDNGSLTGAIATSVQNAEVLGIVSSVSDANNFCIITKGFISGFTAAPGSNIANILPLVTGNAYFLSPDNQGGMIAEPDSGANALEFGEVRKPLLVALSSDSGYVHNYLGVVEGSPTDVVDVQGLNPVGMIMPFSGTGSSIPYGWMLCNGDRLEKSAWSELYNAIGQNYYVKADLASGGGQIGDPNTEPPITLTLEWGKHNLKVNDAVTIEGVSNSQPFIQETYVTSVSGPGSLVSFASINTADLDNLTGLKIRGRINTTTTQSLTSIFFLPDLRRRVLVGATKGLTGSLSPIIDIGDMGGSNNVALSSNNIPNHSHRLNQTTVASGTDVTVAVGFDNASLSDTQAQSQGATKFTAAGVVGNPVVPASFDNMQEYLTVNWIIRARKGLSAMILSGHNHDDRYIRYDAAHPDLTLVNRSTFRNNSKTLGNGYDGDDTFRAKLTITGGAVIGDNGGSLLTVNSGASFGGGVTFNGAFAVRRNEGIVQVNSNLSGYLRLNVAGPDYYPGSCPIADILIENGPTNASWNSIATSSGVLPANAALKVRGGSQDRATIAIFNDNANGYENSSAADGMYVSFYGHGLTGTTVSPKLAGNVVAEIHASSGGIGTITRSIGLQIGNESNTELDVLRFSKVDSGTVRTTLPQSLPNATTTEVSTGANVILTSTNELKKASGAGFGPKFVTPIEIINQNSPPASSNNLVDLDNIPGLSTTVPTTATALIIETETKMTGPDNDASSLLSAKTTIGGPSYKFGGARAAGSGDSVAYISQVTIPIDVANRRFYWDLSYRMNGYFITRVVGYY
jgi:microcystin-dependent protein